MLRNKIIILILLLSFTVIAPLSVFADEKSNNSLIEIQLSEEVLASIEDVSTDEVKTLTSEIRFLYNNGFSKSDLIILGRDIYQVSNIIRDQAMNEAEIKVLREGFVNYRPSDPEELAKKIAPLDISTVSQGMSQGESGDGSLTHFMLAGITMEK